jgi:hypothetical protein
LGERDFAKPLLLSQCQPELRIRSSNANSLKFGWIFKSKGVLAMD